MCVDTTIDKCRNNFTMAEKAMENFTGEQNHFQTREMVFQDKTKRFDVLSLCNM